MTTTELATKNYERLDGYVDKIVNGLQKTGELIQEYLNAANEEGIEERDAWAYLKGKVPKATYYKYLPLEFKDPRKQNRKKDLNTNFGLTETKTNTDIPSEFNTKGMGVVDEEPPEAYTPPIDPEPEVQTQSVSLPTSISDQEHDRLVARIQELEKMVSELSFQKGADTITPPTQQIIIVPHEMVVEIGRKRYGVNIGGIMKLTTENNIVTGIEVVNVQ